MWTFSVTNAQTAIIAPYSGAFVVELRENSATPTALFTFWPGPNPPAVGAPGIVCGAGKSVYYNVPKDSPVLAGQVIGYIQATLAGPFTFVALESPQFFSAAGDLTGTADSQTVVGLEGIPLDAATVGAPNNGDVLTYDTATGKWIAKAP